ncbi:MAG: hypothetical protein U1E76_02445 [Planctomycetota bacterium]
MTPEPRSQAPALFAERLLQRLDDFVFLTQKSTHAPDVAAAELARIAGRRLQEGLETLRPWLGNVLLERARRLIKKARRLLGPLAEEAILLRRMAHPQASEAAAFERARELVLGESTDERARAHDRVRALRLHRLHAQLGGALAALLQAPPDAPHFFLRLAASLAERKDLLQVGWSLLATQDTNTNTHRLLIDTTKLLTMCESVDQLHVISCRELIDSLEEAQREMYLCYELELLDDLLSRVAASADLVRDRLDLVSALVRMIAELRAERLRHLELARALLDPARVNARLVPALAALKQAAAPATGS